MNEQVVALIDLREEEFRTRKELEALVQEAYDALCAYYPGAIVSDVLISFAQQKRLRFERYLDGVPEKQLKQEILWKVGSFSVVVSLYENGCPNCGDTLHWE